MTEKSEILAQQAKSAGVQAGSGPTIELVTRGITGTDRAIRSLCIPGPPCVPCPPFCPPNNAPRLPR